ncbi:MAG TPA: hypothetical protein VHA52_11715 [Candidatus Babeliaceae bacterium]|nr:hypothetical protein [Candidatus Babeliaceae bacterium]
MNKKGELKTCIKLCMDYRWQLEEHISEIDQEMRTHTWFVDSGKELLSCLGKLIELLSEFEDSNYKACMHATQSLYSLVQRVDAECAISAGDVACAEWCKQTIVACDQALGCWNHLLTLY